MVHAKLSAASSAMRLYLHAQNPVCHYKNIPGIEKSGTSLDRQIITMKNGRNGAYIFAQASFCMNQLIDYTRTWDIRVSHTRDRIY